MSSTKRLLMNIWTHQLHLTLQQRYHLQLFSLSKQFFQYLCYIFFLNFLFAASTVVCRVKLNSDRFFLRLQLLLQVEMTYLIGRRRTLGSMSNVSLYQMTLMESQYVIQNVFSLIFSTLQHAILLYEIASYIFPCSVLLVPKVSELYQGCCGLK